MEDDVRAIEALIRHQMKSLAWAPGREADWEGFARGFLPGALLVQSPRPVQPRTVPQFLERQQGLARGPLPAYEQRVLGMQVTVFGNIAVALAGGELAENGVPTARNVAALVLVKDAGAWKIVGQAWDRASAERPLPEELSSDA